MTKINQKLGERFKKKGEISNKMSHLAKLRSQGELSSFSGLFRSSKLSIQEKDALQNILTSYQSQEGSIDQDLEALSLITVEIKAINNQAAMLHGERIAKAQKLLKNYQSRAFSSWLISVYGNRQTPYNFLQYYNFYSKIPKALQEKVDLMPRQAVYTLASRSASDEEKSQIVSQYKGESKKELLRKIRERFPLKKKDQRQKNVVAPVLNQLKQVLEYCQKPSFSPDLGQKKEIEELLLSIQKML